MIIIIVVNGIADAAKDMVMFMIILLLCIDALQCREGKTSGGRVSECANCDVGIACP